MKAFSFLLSLIVLLCLGLGMGFWSLRKMELQIKSALGKVAI